MSLDFSSFHVKLEQLGLKYSESLDQQFEEYYRHLIEINEVMNLTAITEWPDVVDKHFVDSLGVAALPDEQREEILALFNDGATVMDLGTGAGFPGLPLKIMFPQIQLILTDSLRKRINFLQECGDILKLSDVTYVHSRAEILAKDKSYREMQDIVVSRAVANLATLAEYCLPFVKVGGYFIAYKTDTVEEEIQAASKAIQMLGGEVSFVHHYVLPGTDLHRSILLIRKVKSTPKRYPRKAGVPSKEPLS